MGIEHPWALIVGIAILGWLAPEILAAIAKRPAPIAMNIYSAVAFGLIAYAFC